MKTKHDNAGTNDLQATEAGRRMLERERVWVEATENLSRLMASTNVSKAELARRLGVRPPTVTQMLSGEQNLTLGTLAEAFFVLHRSLHITYGALSNRIEVVDEPDLRPLQLELFEWIHTSEKVQGKWDHSHQTPQSADSTRVTTLPA